MVNSIFEKGSFGYDVDFLKAHKDVIVLRAPDEERSLVAVTAGYQGRVMTTSTNGLSGGSYGWVNYELISSGAIHPHMNAFGGEERFWLAPEGGQYSLFFEKGKPFEYQYWQTPACIDSESYDVSKNEESAVTFETEASLINYSGTHFDVRINREIRVLDKTEIASRLRLRSLEGLRCVAFESINSVTNLGPAWTAEKGLLGIWLLGMFRPSDSTTLIIPVQDPRVSSLRLTDDYFGKVPEDRLVFKGENLFMKGDGLYRSKIGVAPVSARNFAGSYDAEQNVLTIIQFEVDPKGAYMNAKWEMHKNPYHGDVLNFYNDGPLEDGSVMGPFYELESSSSVRPLQPGEKLSHCQTTYHFEGDAASLDVIVRELFGISIAGVSQIFG